MGETKKKILVRSREKNGRGKTATQWKPIGKRTPGRPPKRCKELAVLPGTDPEGPAKLTDRKILNMNKKKKTKTRIRVDLVTIKNKGNSVVMLNR